MHPQLTVEILLPELSEPNISPVVGKRAATEILVKRCKKEKSAFLNSRKHCVYHFLLPLLLFRNFTFES